MRIPYHAVFAGALLAAVCMLFTVPRASAQVLYGSIVGEVTDSSSAPVPGAAVKITNTQNGESRSSLTNDAGGYSFPTVPSGTYDVTVTKEGFQTFSARGLTVTVDNVARVDAALRIGSISETVTVSETGATLQT